MKSSRVRAFLSPTMSRVTSAQASTGSSMSSGLLTPSGSSHRFGLANPGKKGTLRLSSSVQDFSTFCKLDSEEDDLEEGVNSLSSTNPHRALERENGGSSFSKEKTLPAFSFVRKKCIRVALCLFCFLLLLFMVYMLSRHFSTQALKYYVILDCGSTGTRVYVYKWSINYGRGYENFPIVLSPVPEDFQREPSSRSGRAYRRMETEPGFDKLVHNASGLQTVVKPLIQWAETQIPKHAHKSTSIFLYATAGVRRLPGPDSKWLLDEAWSILRNSSFLCQRQWVKIITGTEEAYYGWIALNYHMGMLGSLPTKATFGALDLGGSSLQVTFETEEQLIHDETGLDLSIGAVNHHLSAYSLSGYGLNDAFDKSVFHLLKRLSGTTKLDVKNGKVELEHPCLQTGYKEQYICSHCIALGPEGSPSVGGRNSGKGKYGMAIELKGAPNWEECTALAKVAVNLSEWSNLSPGIDCELRTCALSNDFPQPRGQFYAMSGFFVVFRFFNLTSEAKLDDVLQKGQEFCETTWEVAKKSVVPQPFIEQYCFRAPYIVSLLREGLHIHDHQVTIGSGSITWTLGVALLEASQALSGSMEINSYRIFHTTIEPTTLIVLLFLSLILLICALSCIGNWMPRFFSRPYLPLIRHNSASSSSVLNIPSPFHFQRWSPISYGDGRGKMPLSPKVAGSEQRPFHMGHGLGGSSIQLMESSFHPSVSHSYSSGNLGQTQIDTRAGSFWASHRSQMQLQSRRSQSREDLSLAESHLVKV